MVLTTLTSHAGTEINLDCQRRDGVAAKVSAGGLRDVTKQSGLQVFHYMKEYGLPDESCLTYNATDHTKFPELKECPAMSKCLNCMPLQTPAKDVSANTCWPVSDPISYGVRTAPSRVLGAALRARYSKRTPCMRSHVPHACSAIARRCCSCLHSTQTMHRQSEVRMPSAAILVRAHRRLRGGGDDE